ncbi:MAG: repeat protein [Planctomycetota bacterium]|nr:repeat protein [Planctomycetota bacterium]
MTAVRLFLLSALLFISSSRGDTIHLLAGSGRLGDGSPAKRALLESPFGLVEAPSGDVVFVEMTGHRVRAIHPDGVLFTIAGTGKEGFSGDNGPANQAEFKGMHALAVAKDGTLYIADTWNNRVRKIDPKTGRIETVVGTGESGFSGDGGPAMSAKFGGIYSISLTPDGATMVLADLDNRRVRAVDLRTNIVTTVAGNGRKGVPRDGAVATESPLVDPRAVAVDGSGNIYILERSGHALRVVDRSGKVRTVAGTGKAGASGDGGPAKVATLNGPKDLTIDRDGGVLIADTENHLIRKYSPSAGTIIRVAGVGTKGTKGIGGAPEAAELNQPHGVTVDRKGAILVSDSSNHRIVKIER